MGVGCTAAVGAVHCTARTARASCSVRCSQTAKIHEVTKTKITSATAERIDLVMRARSNRHAPQRRATTVRLVRLTEQSSLEAQMEFSGVAPFEVIARYSAVAPVKHATGGAPCRGD